MKQNFTFSKSALLLFAILLIAFSTQSQTTYPKLKFRQPQLYSGIDGTVGATYKFPNVTTGVDAYVKIESINNGAVLVNIDDSTLGYYDAWQPTVSSPGTYGSSYIKWDVEFKTSAGAPYSFSTLAASAIDVDGDNVRVREFIEVNGQSGYDIPTQIPTQLAISIPLDTDNPLNTDAATTNLKALGPVANRVGIDTMSQDVRINFQFSNTSSFKMYTGSEVDSNGTTGAIATSRYHCIYFMDINNTYNVLPVTYNSFDAFLNNNKVQLSWVINSAINNDHFEVERSYDNKDFTTAGIILGAQNVTNSYSNYSFTDDSKDLLQHSVIYYRLKQVNVDGSFSYSTVKVIRTKNLSVANLSMQVMPNPFMNSIKINFASAVKGKAEIKMINASGNVVRSTQSDIFTGDNAVELQSLASQAPGIYVIVMVVNGKIVSSEKVIKQ